MSLLSTNPNIYGLLGMLGFGTSDFLAKKTTNKLHFLTVVFWSQLMGAVFAIILYKPIFFKAVINPSFDLYPAILLGILDAFVTILLFKAFSKGKASIISPLLSTYIIISIIMSFFIFNEKIEPIKYVYILSTFLGVMFLSFTKKTKTKSSISSSSAGIPEVIMAAIILGIYLPSWGKIAQTNNWLLLLIVIRLVNALFTLIIALFKKITLNINYLSIPLILILTIANILGQLSSSIGFSLSNNVIIITILFSAAPLVTLILARIFLKERLSIIQIIGAIITITSTTLLSF